MSADLGDGEEIHLTNEQYAELMHRVGLIASVLVESHAEIRAALRSVTMAEAMAPMLDPTRWINGGGQNLGDARDLLVPLSRAAADLAPLIERVKARRAAAGAAPAGVAK